MMGNNFDMTTKLTRRSNIVDKDFLSSGYTCTDDWTGHVQPYQSSFLVYLSW